MEHHTNDHDNDNGNDNDSTDNNLDNSTTLTPPLKQLPNEAPGPAPPLPNQQMPIIITTSADTRLDAETLPRSARLLASIEHTTDIDPEAMSIASSQSYATALDYEEDSLFETEHEHHHPDSIDESTNTSPNTSQQSHDPSQSSSHSQSHSQQQQQLEKRQQQYQTQQMLQQNQQHPQSVWQQTELYARANSERLRPSEPTNLTILHPALTALPVPSTIAPTIYALASSVPNPTVNQLSMNLLNHSLVTERVAVPFKTIVCPPGGSLSAVASPAGEVPGSSELPIHSRDPSQTLKPAFPEPLSSSSSSSESLATVTGANLATTGESERIIVPDASSDQSSVARQGGDDDIHPYFAASNLLTPQSMDGKSSVQTTMSIEPGAHGWSGMNSGLVSPPLSTSFFTPSSNSTKMPMHHAVRDQHLDPNNVKKKADEQQKAQEDEAAAASGGNSSIGSRTTVFGFAPMYNKGNHQANMQSSEERVLRDGHVCRTLPFDRRDRSSAAASVTGTAGSNNRSSASGGSGDESGAESTTQRSDYSGKSSAMSDGYRSGGSDVNPMLAIPHARAGISPTLNLDQLESVAEVPSAEVEESLESLIESKDWSETGLGPRSSWPEELTMLIPLLMRSASPLAIYWGENCYLIYNDAWRPILKQKHPMALGAAGATVWSEIWDVLGSQMAQVRREGRGSDNKGLRLDLHREGYEEECYFDFTFSPIFLKDGSTGGILGVVQEVTQSILNQRRLTTLNQFSKQAPLIQSVTGAYSMITTILQESNNLDVPFSIVYRTKETAKELSTPPSHGAFSPNTSSATDTPTITATSVMELPAYEDFLTTGSHAGKKDARRVPQAAILCSTSFDRNLEVINYGGVKEKVFSKAISTRHIPDSLLITPEEYEPLDPSDPVYDDPWAWPVRSVLADGIPRLVTLPKSTHKLARALLLPILENPSVLESRITTILIVGINPFQMLDNQYLDFLALLVANIASLLHFGRSREEERKSTEALFELNKAKISFFQNVSHELRTPLTLMLAPLDDVLNQTPENAPTRQSLEMVRRNSRRLLKLVNTLLQFSRIEAGKGHASFEETDLTKATREISANFESVARGFGLDYIINCENLDNIPGGFWVDRAMWGGIILNLIGNAFKHTWEGSITVHQYPCKGRNGREGVALDVRDTGVGIAADNLHTLFGRFNRIENKQSRSHEGTGIGLSLVKELTEVHGGAVSVTSEVDKGTCFHLWIPAGRNHHPSAQIKLGDSKEAGSLLRPPKNDSLNNKTDASMFVEEATQWIAHKSLPGSTLTASGTDSTEEEKPEDDDDMIHIGIDYMCGGQDSVEVNTEFEVSTMDMEECELTKILIDLPESGDVVMPENTLGKLDNQITPRRSSSTAHSPKMPVAEIPNLAFKEQERNVMAVSTTDSMFDPSSINNDGGYGEQVQTAEIVDEPREDKKSLPRARSRRSYIVVVDDNNDMRSYLREILGKDFRVRCAVDGVDAIRLISERLQQGKRIDLVLSDVAMPNMNGYELLKRLRSDSATMTTPFILLSARAGEEANVEGLDLGADDCLVKPFSARELLARVRSTIRLSDLRHELIREQRHALEMKQLIYSISVRIRSGLSLPQILDTASKELFKVIRCNAIRICRFRRVDQETGQHWVRFVSEIVRVGKPKILAPTDRLFPKGLEVMETMVSTGEHDSSSDLRHVSNYQHPVYGAKSFISVALIYNRKIWGYLLASRDADMVDWSQSEKLLFEQTGNQISLAIAHASLWELKKSQQVEMEAAHAANEAKSQILANTSHELRTPIGAIVGALSALEDTDYNLTGEQRDMVKIMQITSDVALSVINDLLDTAKLEAGAMNLNIKECPALVETLEQSVRIFADKAGRKEVDLIMEPSEDLENLEVSLQQGSVIWTDGDRLQQVIMNLIGNAVKFTAAGKVVIQCSLVKTDTPVHAGEAMITEISPEQEQDQNMQQRQEQPQQNGLSLQDEQDERGARSLPPMQIPPDAQVTHLTFRFEVSDTGIGIDPDFLKNHIFKSFAQYDQSMTRRFGGTGLGLAISKHLVMMNGGILGVTSNVGQGSTFYFTWPLAIVAPSQSTTSIPRAPSHPQHGFPARPTLSPEIAFETRVVVVEPLSESRQLLGRILSQQNVQVTLYESCENVVQDEVNRQQDLMGPDGVSVLTPNYRPNAHFFFCTRSSTAELTVETARALALLFKQRNDDAKLDLEGGGENYRDLVLSIVLVVFSSPLGRYLAKDVIKRIRAGGLDQTVQCRYIVKPVKADRIVECMQMMGSHAPYTRGMAGQSPEMMLAGSLQKANLPPQRQQHHNQQQPHDLTLQQRRQQRNGALPNGHGQHHHKASSSSAHTVFTENQSQVIPADGSVSMVSSDYERDNNCNKNTPESSSLDPDGRADSPDIKASSPAIMLNGTNDGHVEAPRQLDQVEVNKVYPSEQHHQPTKYSTASTQRRLRMKTNGDGLSSGKGISMSSVTSSKGVAAGSHSTDESARSSSDNPAFTNRAARAAAGKRDRKGKCILCVEDNIINLRVVQYQLQKLGYDTQSACDGQVAVDIIKAQVEMLSQASSDSNNFTDGVSESDEMSINGDGTSNLENGGMATDGELGAIGSGAEDSDSSLLSLQRSLPSFHLSIGNGLLVIPESNGNMSHIFDQKELSTSHLFPTGAAGSAGTFTGMMPAATTASPSAVPAILSGRASSFSSASSSPSTVSLESITASTKAFLPTASVLMNNAVADMLPMASSSASSSKNMGGKPSKIDLILMDCAMPVKSGFDASSEIRAMGQSSSFAANIPIIALTASAVPSTKEKCIASGMNGYLSKPTKLADLEAMLDQWIE